MSVEENKSKMEKNERSNKINSGDPSNNTLFYSDEQIDFSSDQNPTLGSSRSRSRNRVRCFSRGNSEEVARTKVAWGGTVASGNTMRWCT